jgi:hypothetical protein
VLKKIIAIFILLLLSAVLLSCKQYDNKPQEELIKYEYAEEHARINNLCGSNWLVNESLAVVSVDNNFYRFDKDIKEEERAAFIAAQTEINSFLKNRGIVINGFDFYILNNIESRAVKEENCFYIDFNDFNGTEHIKLTLQVHFGEYTNFGYIFALSEHISQELGWSVSQTEKKDVDIEVFKQSPELLNLSYPVFTEKYSSIAQLNAVRSLSQSILLLMDNVYSGVAGFENKVIEFASQNDIYFAPTYLEFAFGGDCCPVKIRTKYLDIYLDSDYKGSCTLTGKSIREDPMFNFVPMIEFWEFADKDISEVRNIFSYFDEKRIPVYAKEINKTLSGGGEVGGYFVPAGDKSYIEVASIYTITHEYTHYIDDCLDDDADDINWCAEVLACYYGKNMSYKSRSVRAMAGNSQVYSLDDLAGIIGNAYDSVEDEILFQNIMTAHTEDTIYSLVSLYQGRLSFGYYFVTTYGEEKFIKVMFDPNNAEIIVDKSLDDIIEDWTSWLEQFTVSEE